MILKLLVTHITQIFLNLHNVHVNLTTKFQITDYRLSTIGSRYASIFFTPQFP